MKNQVKVAKKEEYKDSQSNHFVCRGEIKFIFSEEKEDIKEKSLIFLRKVFKHNNTSLTVSFDDADIFEKNVITQIHAILEKKSYKEYWTNEGFEIFDLVEKNFCKILYPIIISKTEEILDGDYYLDENNRINIKIEQNGKPSNAYKILVLSEQLSQEHYNLIIEKKVKEGDEVYVKCEMINENHNTEVGHNFINVIQLKNNKVKLFKIEKPKIGWDNLKAIYDKHNVFLTNLKDNLSWEYEQLKVEEIRCYNEQIVLLAGVLSDLNKLIIGETIK